ncbi:MAG: cation:proton antiporter domain-containing protein [Promethearchaeota archaeon]
MEINLFLFLSIVFSLVLLLGSILKRIHVPWIFAALIVGVVLTIYNPFTEATSSIIFNFLADLGMYLLLFMIRFEMDIREMKIHGKFIIKLTFFIILFISIVGTIIVSILYFNNVIDSILYSILIASSMIFTFLVPIIFSNLLMRDKDKS